MKVLVISHTHSLLPLAWRMHREGHDVQTCVWNARYEAAWEGRLVKSPTGPPGVKREALAPQIAEAMAGELLVVTDSHKAQELFKGAPRLMGTAPSLPWSRPPQLCALAWFEGEHFQSRNPLWWMPDWGLWPSGFGALIPGGGVLAIGGAPKPLDCLAPLEAPLAQQQFTGLVLVGLDYLEAARELVPTGFVAGWPWLATHAWMEQLTELGGFLAGGAAVFNGKRYVCVLPVSQPPWPTKGAPGPAPVKLEGLTPEITKRCFWHDIQVVGSDVQTAGLDGLVAVAAGSGMTLGRAQARALEAALALPLPDKQMRPDVGSSAVGMLNALEELGYV